MRKRTTAVLSLVPVVALFAGAGFVQPESQAPGRRGGQPADPGAFVDRIMQQDANGDGKVSREEMGEGPGARIFEGADANTDGFLDKAEIEKFFSERRGGGNRQGQPQAPGVGPAAAPGAPASFHDSMEQAGRALRRLRRSEFNAESQMGDLEGIQAVQRALLDAKAAYMTAEVSEAAKAEFKGENDKLRAALRLNLARGLQAALDAEVAVLEGNSEAAAAAMKKLQEVRDQGHERFEPTEEDNG